MEQCYRLSAPRLRIGDQVEHVYERRHRRGDVAQISPRGKLNEIIEKAKRISAGSIGTESKSEVITPSGFIAKERK